MQLEELKQRYEYAMADLLWDSNYYGWYEIIRNYVNELEDIVREKINED